MTRQYYLIQHCNFNAYWKLDTTSCLESWRSWEQLPSGCSYFRYIIFYL